LIEKQTKHNRRRRTPANHERGQLLASPTVSSPETSKQSSPTDFVEVCLVVLAQRTMSLSKPTLEVQFADANGDIEELEGEMEEVENEMTELESTDPTRFALLDRRLRAMEQEKAALRQQKIVLMQKMVSQGSLSASAAVLVDMPTCLSLLVSIFVFLSISFLSARLESYCTARVDCRPVDR